ncbi:MAG: glycosyltransferase, partial [Sandaracinobacteroides sp.]
RGHEVDIFCMWGTGWPDVLSSAGKAHGLLERCHVSKYAEASWLARLVSAPFVALSVVRHQGLRIAATALDFVAHRKRFKEIRPIHELSMWNHVPLPDIIHCQFGTLGDPMLRHIRSGAMPSALVVHFRGHDVDPHILRVGPDCYDDLFRNADAFIANSVHFRDRAIAFGCPPDRIQVVESPVDISNFPWRPPSPPAGRPVRLLTVARLTEKKGVAYAVDAAAELARRGRDFSYRILGAGEDRAALQARIDGLGLSDRVTLIGGHPHDVVAAELAAADIFLGPSITDRHGETDAAINTIKEAMLVGLPVIATWHGGIPELVEDGLSGLLVPERDATAIADAVETLLDGPELWAPMADRARAAVEQRFSIDAIARQTLEVYETALARRRARLMATETRTNSRSADGTAPANLQEGQRK